MLELPQVQVKLSFWERHHFRSAMVNGESPPRFCKFKNVTPHTKDKLINPFSMKKNVLQQPKEQSSTIRCNDVSLTTDF
jgi:hypothetical protein